jgi:hypothetical protein
MPSSAKPSSGLRGGNNNSGRRPSPTDHSSIVVEEDEEDYDEYQNSRTEDDRNSLVLRPDSSYRTMSAPEEDHRPRTKRYRSLHQVRVAAIEIQLNLR